MQFTIRDLLTWTLSLCALLGAWSLIPVLERHQLPAFLAPLSILPILGLLVIGRVAWNRWRKRPKI